jgi:hypothetical protein
MTQISAVLISAVAAVLIGILVYSSVGAYLESSYVTIYDNLPTESAPRFISNRQIQFIVSNGAPLALPFVSPTFSLAVHVIANESKIECEFMDVFGEERRCEKISLSLGRIPPSGSGFANLLIRTDGDFTLEVSVVMYFFFPITARSEQIACRALLRGPLDLEPTYACTKI